MPGQPSSTTSLDCRADFDGDLYDQLLTVDIVAWLRGEESFSSLEGLIGQIRTDAASARHILAATANSAPR